MNVENRTIFEGDNLHILRGFDSETIDLIYLDPPFNSNREAPIGSAAVGAAEFTHGKQSMKAYLIMMGIRMLEMRRVLKSTGSIYLHCDPTAGHYLKLVMDAVFGKGNFRNEIVLHYKGNSITKKLFPSKHDTLLYYALQNPTFNPIYVPYAESTLPRYNHTDEDGRRYKISALGDGKQEKVYMGEGRMVDSVWDIPVILKTNERTGYPTQKPLALLDRIIKVSSNEGDMVLDPFCGSATTCIAAEALQRQWIGIDLSAKVSVELVKMRLKRDLGLDEDEANLLGDKLIHRTDIPTRLQPEEPQEIHTDPLLDRQVYKHILFGLQEGKCNGCEVLFSFRNLTIDHIHPRSKDGTDDPDNLQLLCAACNSTKGNRTQAYLIQALKEQGVRRD